MTTTMTTLLKYVAALALAIGILYLFGFVVFVVFSLVLWATTFLLWLSIRRKKADAKRAEWLQWLKDNPQS